MSGDSVRGQQLFKKAHNLNFTLLADEKGLVAKVFGVPTRKGGTLEFQVLGKKEALTRGVTPARWTFIVGKEGTVLKRMTKVNAAANCKNVLKAIESLKAQRATKKGRI